jgi:hypothetical protein
MISITKLYNDTITVNFDPLARNRYLIAETGRSPVGVTTVLDTLSKPALMMWPMNEYDKYVRQFVQSGVPVDEPMLNEALHAYLIKGDTGKDVGKRVHGAIESHLKGEHLDIPDDIQKPYKAFLGWVDKFKPEVLSIEKIVYSKANDYAGTFDAILRINGEVVLCDWKTTNASRTAPLGIYSEHFLQLGGYNLAYREEKFTRLHKELGHNYADEYPTDLMVIRVGKEGVVNTLRASELGLTVRECEVKFLEVLKLYKMLAPLSKLIKEGI